MPSYQVYSSDTISTTIDVKLSEEEVEGKSFEEIMELVSERAFEDSPGGLCIHCSGTIAFGVKGKWSRELNDDPCEPVIMNENGIQIYPRPNNEHDGE